jgi:hypothetical protein
MRPWHVKGESSWPCAQEAWPIGHLPACPRAAVAVDAMAACGSRILRRLGIGRSKVANCWSVPNSLTYDHPAGSAGPAANSAFSLVRFTLCP